MTDYISVIKQKILEDGISSLSRQERIKFISIILIESIIDIQIKCFENLCNVDNLSVYLIICCLIKELDNKDYCQMVSTIEELLLKLGEDELDDILSDEFLQLLYDNQIRGKIYELQ